MMKEVGAAVLSPGASYGGGAKGQDEGRTEGHWGPEHPPSSELERAVGGGSRAITAWECGQLKSSQGQPVEGNFQNMWRRVIMKHRHSRPRCKADGEAGSVLQQLMGLCRAKSERHCPQLP